MAEGRAEPSRPHAGATYRIRDDSSFQPWLIDPLIARELLARIVATAELFRMAVLGLVLDA